MKQGKVCILAIDDEPRYQWALQTILTGMGYIVSTAGDGQSAIERAADEEPDLILLDVKLPDMDGYEVCRQMRTFSTVPIIMLTALAGEAEKVRGLDAGADDYVTKPFSTPELLARVRAALRRADLNEVTGGSAVCRAGDLEVDLSRGQVTLAGQAIELTAIEYKLLCELIKQPKRVLVPDYLLDKVWGVGYEGEYHLLRQVVYRLRLKIEPDPGHPQYILTRPGIGYVLAAPGLVPLDDG